MTTISLTSEELQKIESLRAQGKLSEAWKILGDKGDSYGFLATHVLSKVPSDLSPVEQFFHLIVRIQWENTVPGLWGTSKWEDVGKAHLKNYMTFILDHPAGQNTYDLPTTKDIEASYRKALVENLLPPRTAIDSLFSVIDYAWGSPPEGTDISWAKIMDVGNWWLSGPRWPEDRIVYNSDVFLNDLDPTEAAINVGRNMVDGVEALKLDLIIPYPFLPMFWTLGAFDSLIDYRMKDFGYHFAVVGLCKKMGMEIKQADYLLSIVDDDEHAAFSILTDKFGKLLLGNLPPSNESPVKLFDNAKAINDWLNISGQGLELKLIDGIAVSSVIASAQALDGVAWRYALKELNPFVMLGDTSLYEKHNGKGELDLFNFDAGTGSLSKEWIEDRAAMLSWMMKLNKDDIETLISNPYNGGVGNICFEDVSSGEKIYLGTKRGLTEERQHFVFGSDEADHSITGGVKNDRLYGMGGDDAINGKGGNDYLEGGKGNDIYVFQSTLGNRDGKDTIIDSDGGFICRAHKQLAKGEYVEAGHWKAIDNTEYFKQGNDLLIKFNNGDQVFVKHFDFAAALTEDLSGSALQRSFGIELLPPPKVAILPGSDLKADPTRSDNIPAVHMAMNEGANEMFTVYVSSPSDQARKITISLAGIDLSKFALSTGVKQYDFSNGKVTLTLAAGETHLSFALVNTGDIDSSGHLTLKATLKGLDGSADLKSNLADIDFTAVIELDDGFDKYVIDYDGEHQATNLGLNSDITGKTEGPQDRVHFDMRDGNDLIQHSNSGDEIHAGLGNDLVLSTSEPKQGLEQLANGDDGNDWIQNTGGGGKLYGDAGNDILGEIGLGIYSYSWIDPVGGTKAAWLTWDVLWQAIGSTWHTEITAGKVTNSAGGLSFGGGSWYSDGNGNRVLRPEYHFASTPSIQFTAADEITYTSIFVSDGGAGGVWTLKWTEGGQEKWAQAVMKEYSVTIKDQPGKALMNGGIGNDLIVGANAGNTLVGGAGDDLIQGGSGIDRAYGDGGPADKLSQVGAGNDQMALGSGDDYADGGNGDDIIIGEDGQDSLFGGRGNDVMVAGKWSSTHSDQGSGDYLNGEDGNDKLYGSTGADTLIGGAGNDYLTGEWGGVTVWSDDYLNGGDGTDTLLGAGGSDKLLGGAGADTLYGDSLSIPEARQGDDELYGEAGDDELYAYGGNDWLSGGADNDQLDGGKGDDILDGGSGNDELNAGEGDDLLAGGAGQDILQGGLGNDVYQIELGDSLNGQTDSIVDNSGANTLRFGGGIRLTDINIKNGGSSTTIKFSDNDTIVVQNGLAGAIRWVEFADGSRLTIAELIGRTSDTAVKGQDALGSDILLGGKGADQLASNGGSAIISGGRGDDVLKGFGNSNSYLYSQGDGKDLLFDNGSGNRIIFGEDIRATDIEIRCENGALVLVVGDGPGDEIHIRGFDANQALANPSIATFQFADGTSLSYAELLEQGFDFSGTTGNDALAGTSVNDRFDGGAGNDELRGGAGDDVYHFNAGDGRDTIIDAQGTNVIQFGEGLPADGFEVHQRITSDGRYLDLTFATGESLTIQNGELGTVQYFEFADGTFLSVDDLLSMMPSIDVVGTPGNDSLSGYAGDDVLHGMAGDDQLSGGAGNDGLIGGSGNDVLMGGAGADEYVFGRLAGQDVLIDSGSELNSIRLEPELDFSSLRWHQSGDNLVLSLRGGSDTMTVQDFFASGAQQNWQLLTASGVAMSLTDFIDLPDPYGADRIAGLMDDFKLGAWQNLMREQRAKGYEYIGDGKFALYDPWSEHSYTFSVDQQTQVWFTPEVDEEGNVVITSNVIEHLYRSPLFSLPLTARGDRVEEFTDLSEEHSNAQDIKISIPLTALGSIVRTSAIATFEFGEKSGEWQQWVFDTLHEYYRQEGKIVALNYNTGGFTGEGSTMTGNQMLVDTEVYSQAFTYFHKLTAGDADNNIDVSGNDEVIQVAITVDGGAGDDTISGGKGDFYYGNTGNDTLSGEASTLAGGDGDDCISVASEVEAYYGRADEARPLGSILIGGNGSDLLIGNIGADCYRSLDRSETGKDLVVDKGSDLPVYAQQYYETLGIDYAEEEYPTQWVLSVDEEVVVHFNTYQQFLQFWNSWSGGDDYWIKQNLTLEELLTDGYLRPPLPLLSKILATDFAQVETLVDVGIIMPDVVDLPPGITADNLGLAWGQATYEGTSRVTLDLSWDGAVRMQIVMPSSNSELGTGIEQFRFADGTIWSMQKMVADLPDMPGTHVIYGSASNDVLTGQASDEVFYGLSGDDTILSGSGADSLGGGDGNDDLQGGDGADVLRGGDGIDQMDGGGGSDVLIGGAGNDILYGRAGNDSLNGGEGDDVLNGSTGNDVYIFGPGFDHDVIVDSDATANNIDILYFREGVSLDELVFERVGMNLKVKIAGSPDDDIVIRNWYVGSAYHIEQFRLTDGYGPEVLLDTEVEGLLALGAQPRQVPSHGDWVLG